MAGLLNETKRGVDERSLSLAKIADAIKNDVMNNLRVSMPGIIDSFDAEKQTANIIPAIRKRVAGDNSRVKEEQEPMLLDVPVLFLGGGSSYLTFPVKKGDECLVVFADNNIDAWFQSGGVQNQVYPRRHDLSDAFAIVGFRSQPNKLDKVNLSRPNIVGGLLVDGSELSPLEHGHVWDDLSEVPSVFPTDWASVSDKPEVYPTDWTNVDDKPSYFKSKWSMVEEKPQTFPPSSHGNHVPETQTANNAIFLRNDNTWQTVTPANIGAAEEEHDHVKADISDFPSSMPASDVKAWAKADTKPSYVWGEIGSKPNTFPPSSHAHTKGDITDFPTSMPPSAHDHVKADITDFPTSMPASDVYSWAKAETKPDYTASEVGVSNRNILHNWDMRSPINQREKSGAINTVGYFFDRWILRSGTVTIQDGSLLMGQNAEIEQRIEGKVLAGKTVTFSLLDTNGNIVHASGAFPASTGMVEVAVTGFGTITLGNAAGYMYVYVKNTQTSYELAALKLELGSTSTLAYDPPMDWAVEELKCKRFYQNLTGYYPIGYVISGKAYFINHIKFVPLLRVVPTYQITHLYMGGVGNLSPSQRNALLTLDDEGVISLSFNQSTAINANNYVYFTASFNADL